MTMPYQPVTPEPPPEPRRSKSLAFKAGLIGAGVAAGALAATAISATAASGGSSSAPSTSSSTTATTTEQPGEQAGEQGGEHGGGHDGEKAPSAATAATLKAAALKAVPGGTVVRVESDSGDAAYEAHMKKSDGTEVTVKFDKNLKVTGVEEGMGK